MLGSYSKPQIQFFSLSLSLTFKWQPTGDRTLHPCAPTVLSQREHLDKGQLAAAEGDVKQPEVKTLESQSALWNIHLPQASPRTQQRWFIALGHFWAAAGLSNSWGCDGNSSMWNQTSPLSGALLEAVLHLVQRWSCCICFCWLLVAAECSILARRCWYRGKLQLLLRLKSCST